MDTLYLDVQYGEATADPLVVLLVVLVAGYRLLWWSWTLGRFLGNRLTSWLAPVKLNVVRDGPAGRST